MQCRIRESTLPSDDPVRPSSIPPPSRPGIESLEVHHARLAARHGRSLLSAWLLVLASKAMFLAIAVFQRA